MRFSSRSINTTLSESSSTSKIYSSSFFLFGLLFGIEGWREFPLTWIILFFFIFEDTFRGTAIHEIRMFNNLIANWKCNRKSKQKDCWKFAMFIFCFSGFSFIFSFWLNWNVPSSGCCWFYWTLTREIGSLVEKEVGYLTKSWGNRRLVDEFYCVIIRLIICILLQNRL